MKQTMIAIPLAAVLLLAACQAPLGPRGPADGLPEGTGQVSVDLRSNDGPARTAYPDMPVVADFAYKYFFTPAGGSALEKIPEGAYGSRAFTLPVGTYTLEVRAYNDTAKTNQVAVGTASFAVSAGVTTPVPVNLLPETALGSGTLNYTVTYPATATLTSLTYAPVDTPLSTTTLESSATGGFTYGTVTAVPVGCYLVIAQLSDGGKTTGNSEVVYIYQRLSTTVDFIFTAWDFTTP
ncbi:hypothetical protein AGMMS49928_12640 [Spirochaetia bacterium]|nr:hypothetical protein AGMMS49928_12640 [Spirochaetia bacterium]